MRITDVARLKPGDDIHVPSDGGMTWARVADVWLQVETENNGRHGYSVGSQVMARRAHAAKEPRYVRASTMWLAVLTTSCLTVGLLFAGLMWLGSTVSDEELCEPAMPGMVRNA